MGALPDYERMVAPHLVELRKYCGYLAKSKWDADDLFQETLLKSLVFFRHTEPRVEIKPFLVRVARNLWIDECRKRRRRRLALAEQQPADCAEDDYAEVSGTVEWLAERFPKRNIEIWLLFYYFGYTMQEIARAMNCTVSAVKSLLHRTREMLRDRNGLSARRKAVRLDVERWSRAILQDRPQGILS